MPVKKPTEPSGENTPWKAAPLKYENGKITRSSGSMERVGGFGGKADQLNGYYTRTGMPDFFEEDLSRYRALSAEDIRSAVVRYLPRDKRVELSIVPEAKK